MSSSSIIYKIQSNPIGQAKCINCGHNWGQHAGVRCPRDGTRFEPEGFRLSDICGNCGKPLHEHHKRAACRGNSNNCFVKSDMFSMKDFEL